MFFTQKMKNDLNKTSLSKLVHVYFASIIFVFINKYDSILNLINLIVISDPENLIVSTYFQSNNHFFFQNTSAILNLIHLICKQRPRKVYSTYFQDNNLIFFTIQVHHLGSAILNLTNLIGIKFVTSDPEKLIVHTFKTIT
jgi:hypothetical protein